MRLKRRRLPYNSFCTSCREFFDITCENVEIEEIPRGYDYTIQEYVIKCPKCKKEVERVKKLSDFPFKLALQIWKKHWKKEN